MLLWGVGGVGGGFGCVVGGGGGVLFFVGVWLGLRNAMWGNRTGETRKF